MGPVGLEGRPGEKRTQKDKPCLYVFIILHCTHVPSSGLNVVCCVVDPKMLLTVMLAL